MTLEQAVHQHWSTCKPLCDCIPTERFFTGLAEGCVAFPYATLARVRTVSSVRTSGSRRETIELRMSIWDDDLERGQLAAAELNRRFDRAQFAWSAGQVLDVRRVNYAETQQPDGVWLLAGDFHFRISQSEDA